MSRFVQVELSGLPAPSVIEGLDFEAIFSAYREKFVEFWDGLRADDPSLPAFDVGGLETDPAMIAGQAQSFRELLVRARINDAAKAVLLAYSGGSDLDHLGALFGVARLGDPSTGSGESDARLRRRIQLAPEAFASAGAEGGYLFHALTADPTLRDVSAAMVRPGTVRVTLMASMAAPMPTPEQVRIVRERLHESRIKPLTDVVIVAGPTIRETPVEAELVLYPGPSQAAVLAAARAGLDAFLARTAWLGYDLQRSAIIARLHAEGVHTVRLIAPAADIEAGPADCFRVTDIKIRAAGRDE